MNNKCKQYRMADVFDLPLEPDTVLFGYPVLKGMHKKKAEYAIHAINTHDAMQDRIAELEQLNDELHSFAYEKSGLAFTVNNDSVFIDGFGDLPIGSVERINQLAAKNADTQAKAIEDFQTYFDKEYYGEELSQFIENYADEIRQQAKGEL